MPIDGAPARACIAPAVSLEGAEVRGLEGMAEEPRTQVIKEASHQEHGLQCGSAPRGMLISVGDILGRAPECAEAEPRIALSGNLCRCTGYQGIVRSAPRAAKQLNAGNEVGEEQAMRTTIVGGAMLPHAAQFFTQPDTEDKDAVARVKQVAAEIGTTLKALEPNLWIIFATDDAIGIPLTRLGVSAPVPPIYVNAYLPPQPTPERCYAFGQAVARCVSAMGLRTVVLASGGMSHFPGAERYGNPALDWDEKVLARIAEGNLKSLAGYDEADLDETGNVELRCWACAADMLGGRKPDVVSMEPSWHHDYASLGWFEA